MLPSGMIIAFEGLDCSFKETNYREYCRRLTTGNPNMKIFVESFPRYNSDSSLFIKRWLNGDIDRNHLMKHSRAVDSFYSLDRLSYWYDKNQDSSMMIEHLAQNACFIFDRYNFSNAIYNPINGNMPTIDDFMLDTKDFGVPNPDIVVWMHMRDFSVLENLVRQKNNKDANEKDLNFLKTVWERSEYVLKKKYLKKIGVKCIVIECIDQNGNIRSKEDIANDVWNSIENTIRKIKLERGECINE